MPLERLRANLYEWLVNTPMPLRLVFVRHGQSEGNVANEMIRQGRYDEIPVGLHGYPGWKWRLSAEGERQAVACGNFLRSMYPEGFDAAYNSSFVRAQQTAGLIGEVASGKARLQWKQNLVLRERDYGRLDTIPKPDDLARHLEYLKGRTEDRASWSPPGGESIDRVRMRADRFFATLHRHHSLHRVVAVAHGDLITAALLELCRMQNDEFLSRKAKKDPLLHIDNCQVLEFTRIDPESGTVSDHMDWVRSICPWDPEWQLSPCASWTRIVRRTYTSDELLEQARRFTRYF